jgi:hypothetical protein
MLFRCIICLEIFDHNQSTEEHVFPESIGGRWSIWDLCKPCNDRLGENADADLVNDFWIQIDRQRLRLPGKDGRIPNPFDSGKLVRRQHPGAEWESTSVRWEEENQYLYRHPLARPGEMVYDARDTERAEADAAKRRKRRPNETPLNVRMADPDRIDGVLNYEIRSHVSLCARGLVKIIYEFAYRLLGYHYLGDVNGRAMQRFLHSGEPDVQRLEVSGAQFLCGGVRALEGAHRDELIGGLFRNANRTMGFVQIFDRVEALIEVSRQTWHSIDTGGVAFVFDVQKKTERATNFRALGMKGI